MIRGEVLEHVAPPLIILWPLILKCATATSVFLKIDMRHGAIVI